MTPVDPHGTLPTLVAPADSRIVLYCVILNLGNVYTCGYIIYYGHKLVVRCLCYSAALYCRLCLTKLLVQIFLLLTEQNYRITQLNLFRLGKNENKLLLTCSAAPQWAVRRAECAPSLSAESPLYKCFECLSPAHVHLHALPSSCLFTAALFKY